MTVANVVLEAHRARLVCDTVGYIGTKPAVLNRKVRIVEGTHLAFICRGRVVLSNFLFHRGHAWSSFDDAAADILDQLNTLPADFFQDGTAETTLLGWDRDRPRVARLVLTSPGGSRNTCRLDLQPGCYLAPSLGAHKIPASMSDEQLCKVAILQQEIAQRHGLNMCVGGDIEVATITAEGITIRKLAEYPDKWKVVEQIQQADRLPIADIAA